MVELVDALDSKSSVRKYMWVQVPPPANLVTWIPFMPLIKPHTETRSKERVTTVLAVDCKVSGLPSNRGPNFPLKIGDSFGGRTINVSADGVLINSDYQVDKGTLLDLAISSSEQGKPKTKLTAKVAWSRRNAFDLYGRWAMGMQLVKGKTEDLKSLSIFFKQA